MNLPRKKVILGYITLTLTLFVVSFETNETSVNAFVSIIFALWGISVIIEGVVLIFLGKWGLGLTVLILATLYIFLPDLVRISEELLYKFRLFFLIIPIVSSMYLVKFEKMKPTSTSN